MREYIDSVNTYSHSELDTSKVLFTIKRLSKRIDERFPDSSLYLVCIEFYTLASTVNAEMALLNRPKWAIRVLIGICAIVLILVLWVVTNTFIEIMHSKANSVTKIFSPSEFVQSLEAGINELIFLGLAFAFLLNWEVKIKRNKSLKFIKQLYNIAHLIDMHQLTKDPTAISEDHHTESSPNRITNSYDLIRYLDYCSEMLSLISKVGALLAK